MNYNIYISANYTDHFHLAFEKEEVEKIADAYHKGADEIMLVGRDKISFSRLDKLTVYEANDKTEDFIKHFLNSTATRGMGPYRAWREDQLKKIGDNVTKDFIKFGFGEGEEIPVDLTTIFDQLTSVFFHEKVVNISGPLFSSGHYKQAAQESTVSVITRVREIHLANTGKDLDGKPLMMAAFSEENPVIRLFGEDVNDWKGLQEGYKFIFAGLVLAIRNPKAHANFDIDKVDAIELLFLCSRLHKKLDNAV